MNYPTRLFGLSVFLFACAASQRAQTPTPPPVLTVFAVLSTTVDTNTSARGDEVLMTTVNDVVVGGTIMMPKGSKLVGHVGGIISKHKEEPKSVIAIAIDRVVTNGTDQPLQAIIAAVAAPRKALPEDPTGRVMHSNEQKTTGATVPGRTSAGNLPVPNKTSQNAGVGDQQFVLTENSQGAYGYEDVAISWHLTVPPPLTIFATKAKRLRLESGTQLLLRMFPPSTP